MTEITIIREAKLEDVFKLTHLYEQLGYPTTTLELEKRLQIIFSHTDYHTLVATKGEKVVGMIGLIKNHSFEYDDCYIRIAILIVDEDCRGQGIGKELIQEAEKWAKSQDITAIVLNSGNRKDRKQAHEFYQRLGYLPKSTGFTKEL